MWLVITFLAALSATAIHFGAANLKKYRFGFLALMLWGTFIMVLVDHSISFMNEGGEFIGIETDGLVPNAAVLGFLMVLPLLAIWAAAVSRPVPSSR